MNLLLSTSPPDPLGMGWLQFAAAISWPLVAIVSLGLLLLTRGGSNITQSVLSRLKSVTGLGVTLELTTDTASEVKTSIEDVLATYGSRIQRAFDQQVHNRNLGALHGRVVEAIRHHLPSEVQEFRSTIHVQDALFADTLYQLLDYDPGEDGGRGRRISIRFGIVGKAWRQVGTQVEAEVPTAPRELIEGWGMTRAQAAGATGGRRSFACVPLRDGHENPIGILYCDSRQPGAFGPPSQGNDLTAAIERAAREVGLTEALASLVTEMRPLGPEIRAIG